MRLYELLGGGASIYPHPKHWQTRGVWEHAPPGNFAFGFLLDAIWWNLGLFLHKYNLSFLLCHYSFYKGLN